MEAAIIGSSLISGIAGADASRRAANTQADAARQAAQMQLTGTREANQLQWAMYQQALQNQAPYLRGGQTAYAALMGGMGLGSLYQPPPQPNAAIPRPTVRPLEAGGAGDGGVAPGGPNDMMTPAVMPNEAMGTAGGVAPGAAGTTFDPGNLPPSLQPRTIGATPEEMAGAAGQYGGRFTERFTGQDIYRDPSYEFRLQEGLRALKAAGAATGMLQTGQGLKDITNYGQQAASQEYGAAYGRFMEQQREAYNRLASLAGVGQTAASGISGAGQAAGSQIGSNIMAGTGAAANLLTGGAAAQAGGMIGGVNALTGAAQGGIQNWMTMQYLRNPNPYGYQAPNYAPVTTAVPTPVYGPAQPGMPGP